MASHDESYFAKISNSILEAAEQIVARFDEGLAVITSGKIPDNANLPPNLQNDVLGSDDVTMEMEEEMLGSPLEGMADSVLKDILKGQSIGPQTPMEHINAFRSAITWNEPFIIGLIAFQVIMFTAALYVSKRDRGIAPRLTVMVMIGSLVKLSQHINSYAAEHWASFATQNYFDKRGVFIGIMFCGPLLLNCFMMLFLFLREASQLLIEVKKYEIKKQREKEAKAKEGGNTAGRRSKKSNKKKD